MAKITIPYLTFKRLANGTHAGYWEPSPALRRAGWTRLALGADQKAAIAAAERRNEEVMVWRTGGAKPSAVRTIVAPHTFGALVVLFEAEQMDDAARAARFEKPLASKTKEGYRSIMTELARWAEDGRTPLAAIKGAQIEVLKAALLGSSNKRTGAPRRHRAAAMLRVLSMLLAFARAKRLIAENPMDGVRIPTPPPRARIIGAEAVTALCAAAAAMDRADIELGILLGLWTLQREADILALGRPAWRECRDMADDDRRTLAGADGRVMGFRVRQRKTGRWLDIHALPVLRERVELTFAANAQRAVPLTFLIADPDEPRATPAWKFIRGFRAVANRALADAGWAGKAELVEQLTNVQFRDLRRTGMCLMRELGLTVPYIASVSGHSIDETTKILETYMPADTRTNAAAIAMLATRLAERDAARDKKEERA